MLNRTGAVRVREFSPVIFGYYCSAVVVLWHYAKFGISALQLTEFFSISNYLMYFACYPSNGIHVVLCVFVIALYLSYGIILGNQDRCSVSEGIFPYSSIDQYSVYCFKSFKWDVSFHV